MREFLLLLRQSVNGGIYCMMCGFMKSFFLVHWLEVTVTSHHFSTVFFKCLVFGVFSFVCGCKCVAINSLSLPWVSMGSNFIDDQLDRY